MQLSFVLLGLLAVLTNCVVVGQDLPVVTTPIAQIHGFAFPRGITLSPTTNHLYLVGSDSTYVTLNIDGTFISQVNEPYDGVWTSEAAGITGDDEDNLYIAVVGPGSYTSIFVCTSDGRSMNNYQVNAYTRGIVWTKNQQDGAILYLVDKTGNRILVFSLSSGTVIRTLTTSFPALAGPVGIAIDKNSNLYICDPENWRIVVLSPSGTQLREYKNSKYEGPTKVFVDSTHNYVYALSPLDYTSTIIQYDMNSGNTTQTYTIQTHLTVMGMIGDERTGNIYVLVGDQNDPSISQLFIINMTSRTQHTLWSASSLPVYLDSPTGISLDIYGNMYVINYNDYRPLWKLAPNGTHIDSYKVDGNGWKPQYIVVSQSHQPNVYVSDPSANGVRKFLSNGTQDINWMRHAPVMNNPQGVALDSYENIYIVETGMNRILKLDINGTLVTTYTTQGLNNPTGVAVDDDNNLYITDTKNNRIIKMNATNPNQTQIWGVGLLISPTSIVVDSMGYIYVIDSPPFSPSPCPRIVVFHSSGIPIQSILPSQHPSYSNGISMSMTLDQQRNLIVTDVDLHTIMIFAPTTTTPTPTPTTPVPTPTPTPTPTSTPTTDVPTIPSTPTTIPTDSPTSAPHSDSSSSFSSFFSSPYAIAGISVGGLLILIIVVVLIRRCCCTRSSMDGQIPYVPLSS